jgi:hypothetical protein
MAPGWTQARSASRRQWIWQIRADAVLDRAPQVHQPAVEEVAGVGHFHQLGRLSARLEAVDPVVHRLWLDDLIAFALDHQPWTAGKRDRVEIPPAPNRRRNRDQHAGLEVGSLLERNIGAETEAGQPQLRLGTLLPHPRSNRTQSSDSPMPSSKLPADAPAPRKLNRTVLAPHSRSARAVIVTTLLCIVPPRSATDGRRSPPRLRRGVGLGPSTADSRSPTGPGRVSVAGRRFGNVGVVMRE